jgi:cohesin complex subunit SA-1/2
MLRATSLQNTNSTKVLELEDELSRSLRAAVKDREELDTASFSSAEMDKLTAICARVSTVAGLRDMTSWMEEDEDGKQVSAWDIFISLMDRGKLGYESEEKVCIDLPIAYRDASSDSARTRWWSTLSAV